MERIIFWLESKDSNYFEGLELYKTLPNCNKNLLRNLTRGESAFNKQKLIYELKKIVAIPIKQPVIPTTIKIVEEKPTTPVKVSTSIKDQEKRTAPLFHQLPTQLRPVLLEANNLFKENCLLKTELNDLAPDKELEALAIQIKIANNEKTNSLAWKKIDYWIKHKTLPPSTSITLSKWSMDKLIYQRGLLESSLSRQRKRLQLNKEKKSTLEGPELNKISRAISKQEKAILVKEEQLLKIKSEIDGKK